MPPKKKEGGDDANANWNSKIEQAVVNDDKWSCKVVMIESAGGDQDNLYLNKFETFAAEEKRFVIKNICKTETMFMINQLGGEKKVKDPNLRVFEEGQAYLKEKQDIPPPLLSLIIKHLILKMKDEYLFIKRQRMEVQEGMRRESATMINKDEVRGTVMDAAAASIVPTTSPPVSKGKNKGGKGDAVESPEPIEGKKYNTALRERGEEWRDKIYVDDFPLDGPNLYIALSGFQDSTLPMYLVRIGVPVNAIVQIRIDVSSQKVPSSLLRQTKRGQSETDILSERALQFWEELLQIRIDKYCADFFKGTAFIIFSPPYKENEPISGDPDTIYDEICYLLYDIQDLTRQHIHYLDNMDVFHIPEDTVCYYYMKNYQQLIGNIPLECVTLYSVIDSLLKTLCNNLEGGSTTSLLTADTMIPPLNTITNKTDKAVKYVTEVFNTLCKDTKKTYRITYGDEYENHKDPIVINYGDYAKYPTFQLNNKTLDSVVQSSLYRMPIHLLWQNLHQPVGEMAAKLSFHVNVLLSCFDREDIETSELTRLLHILACRKLYNNRSCLIKKHIEPTTISEFKKVYLKRSVMAEPLTKYRSLSKVFSTNNSTHSFIANSRSNNQISATCETKDNEEDRIKFLFDCPDISELVSASEIANQKPGSHMIDDFEYFEDFFGTSSCQVLFDAFNKFNCLDYKYCEVTDCIVLMFFNSHDSDGISREEWRYHLATPLCLQDYFDYILDEHYDWILNEEKLHDEKNNLHTKSQSKIRLERKHKDCLEQQEVDVEMLIEGSIKHQEATQILDSATDITAIGIKKTVSNSTTTNDTMSKSSKKTKSPAVASTPKSKYTAAPPPNNISELSVCEKPAKPFLGYDLGDRRVEVFGKDSNYFSRDGTVISTYYTLSIPMNLEYIILNIVPGNKVNEFWVHRALGDFVTEESKEKCNSFRISTKNQANINVKKQKYIPPPPPETAESKMEVVQTKESGITKAQTVEEEITAIPDYKCFYSCYITWPNGLVTESVHEQHSQLISHICQYYLTDMPNLDENMRCISMNGEVIIFKKSGLIEVLRPDGSFIRIVKCERKLVSDPNTAPSETSFDKGKKGKGGKVKEKPKKGSAMSSKQEGNVNAEQEIDKNAKYEMVYNEYETIDTSGLRQKWVNESPSHLENLLNRTATDYCLGEVFSRRKDGTNFLYNKNGVLIVTFPDGTRIITTYVVEDLEIYPEWTEEEIAYFDRIESEPLDTDSLKSKNSKNSIKSKNSMYQKSGMNGSMDSTMSGKIEEEELKHKVRTDGYISVQLIYTIEHVNFTSVTLNKITESVSIASPNDTTVTIDNNNFYEMILDNVTSATFDGQKLQINYEACPKCKSFTKCNVNIGSHEEDSSAKFETAWVQMKDSFCKKVVVDEEGNINISDEPCSQDTLAEDVQSHNTDTVVQPDLISVNTEKSEVSNTSHSIVCREIYESKSIRFFVLRRELSCSELIHNNAVEEYKQNCRWQSWCTIDTYDTFGDFRSLVSILTPVNLTETEKWLMNSKLASKPKNLTYKDLKADSGKGFYHWMRPYERFEPSPKRPDTAVPPRLPRAFVLRTLEHQWNETTRNELKGAKELLTAILRYRRMMESDSETLLHMPIIDLRPEDERRTDQIIQALAHRIYEDLKVRTANDVQSRAKATITTKPLPEHEESYASHVEQEETEEYAEIDVDLKELDEERDSLLKEIDNIVPMNENLQRYWRRRAEELKEEEFFKLLLREETLPPYFQNILGGAIWSELNDAVGQAATRAERRRMKCVCHEEDKTRTTPTDFI